MKMQTALPDLVRLGLTEGDAHAALDLMRASRIPHTQFAEGFVRYARVKHGNGTRSDLARALAPLVKR